MQDALIEATLKKYQDIIDNLDRISTTLDNSLTLKEARGDTITESDYQRPLDVANKQIDSLYDKREKLLKQQGIYDVGSDKYDDYADQIADIDDEIYGLLGDIEDLKDKIWEVRWQPFFDGQEAAENLRNEMDQFRESLSEDSLISEAGGLTENGITSIALISAAMNSAKQQIKDYSTALEKLEQDLENGNISTSEFEETQLEFLQAIRDSSGEVSDYQNTLIDMYTTMLERENDVVQNSISKQEDLMDIRKQNSDYAKSIRDQTKEINQIQAQINAISGSTNQSSIAERKRLEAQLEELQENLQSSQEDRAYDVRNQGYESLSNDLNDALDSTLEEITMNADKQEEVVSNMLQNIVGQYKTAYSQINQIISSTGLVPSDDFQQVINNIGTQSGAQNQVDWSNTIAPEYNPNDYSSGINTSPIQSGSAQSNNDKIQSEIEKEPNTTNRPVAQITLKPTSLSLQEGKSSTIKATIRPSDAANKSVKWSSSNTKVATVSNGVVKAVKAGSARITCIAQDGSGISASCSVTVTAKPKAQSTKKPTSSGGDGVPKVGDKVTLKGWYYYDSYGKSPAGNRYSGVKNGVVIDSYSSSKYGGKGKNVGGYDVHIKSADGKYGDLGWVKLSQLSGYATGLKKATEEEFAWTQENGPEMVFSPSAGAVLTKINPGDSVIPNNLTENLFKWGAIDPNSMEMRTKIIDSFNKMMAQNCISQIVKDITADSEKAARDMMASVGQIRSEYQRPIVVHYDSLLTVNGDITKETFPGVKKMCQEAYQYTMQQGYREATLQGIRKKL